MKKILSLVLIAMLLMSGAFARERPARWPDAVRRRRTGTAGT